ncbi:hypothetical protein GVN20_26535 [Runella sp. CRIBMP]|uniref:hypothetical protein n=1 Tax=Runella sp. CRIBMP TaxID=2683261 RepID=UPI00141331F7|nr:hypothetical protein [Runella sp. CRIBMP]NBB22942.1 hypothetical protein [Runella sp. CRIBMP]
MSKYLSIIKSFNLKLLRQNLVNLFVFNYRLEFSKLHEDVFILSNKLRNTRLELLYFKVLDYYSKNPNPSLENELNYLKDLGYISAFPYKRLKSVGNIICKYDQNKKMPYVLHTNSKKLYFPETWTIESMKSQYLNLVETENILGGNYLEKAPHQYQTEYFYAKSTDIVLDIGAAEGLFSLEMVDKVKKIYIYEADDLWVKALKATFEPYQDKVVIVNKYVSDKDSKNEITLTNSLKNESLEGVFVKMDIEGDEIKVISGNKSIFDKLIDIRIACCTYHKKDDAQNIKSLLDFMGYSTEFSDGYVLFFWDENIQAPYFRQGMIRAKKVI